MENRLEFLGLKRLSLGLLAVVLLATAACTVNLISHYDEFTDQGVAELQKLVDSFLIGLERDQTPPSCTHESNKSFYTESLASVSSLRVRNEGRPKNGITNQQLQLLEDNIKILEEIHMKKGNSECLSKEEISPMRQNMNSSFTAILKLELAKKRGEKGGQS